MRHISILFVGSLALAAAACASNNTPPPASASSESVAEATSQPNRGPDFAPASSDGTASAARDARGSNTATNAATQPAPDLNPPARSANGSASNGTWGNGAEGSAGLEPSTGNAAAAPADRSSPSATDADNTRINQRDRGGATLTPMNQGGSESDRKITRDIRRAVMGDSTLSFTAKNVKIITVDGKVTLRGPVKTAAERSAIEAAARKVVGNGALVESQIELVQ